MNKKILLIILLTSLSIIFTTNVYAFETGREVFVRHINKSTGNVIDGLQNSNQEVIDISGNSSLLSNSDADDVSKFYSEYYNYPVF